MLMRKTLLLFMASMMLLTANSQTNYSVGTSVEKKKVLLEEFTGQGCYWCTEGHQVAKQLLLALDGNAYAIAEHTGSLSGVYQGIDLRTMQCRAVTDELFCREYRNQKASRCLHLVNDDFAFGDRTISHHKACGFICRNAGREEWKINCRGYLYTNILPCHDCVLFGTAGMGGHFYAVELSSGAIKCDVNTGGTGSFILSGENVYLLSRGSKDSKLLEISTDTWKIREECTIAGTVSSYSRLAVEGDLLYAVSCRYKGNLPRQAYMNVIKIG